MKIFNKTTVWLVFFTATLTSWTSTAGTTQKDHTTYIKSGSDNKIVYYGNEYVDEFSWIRDKNYPEIEDPKVKSLIKREQKNTQDFFEINKPLVDEVFSEIIERRKKVKSNSYTDENFMYTSTYINENQYKSHFYTDLKTNKKKLLIDEQVRSNNLSYYKLLNYQISPDKRYLVWIEDTVGQYLGKLWIRDLDTGKEFDQKIDNVDASFEWAPDSKSIYYVQANENGRRDEIINYQIATGTQKVIYQDKDVNFRVYIDKSINGKDLFIKSASRNKVERYLLSTEQDNRLTLLISRESGVGHQIDRINGIYYIYSNHNNNAYALYKTAELPSKPETWKLVIENTGKGEFSNIKYFKNNFVIRKRHSGVDQLIVVDREAEHSHIVDFGETIIGLRLAGIKQNPQTNTVRVSLQSNITPKTIIDYDMVSKQKTIVSQIKLKGYDKNQYVNTQFFIPSHDGVEVPVTVIYNKKFGFNKKNPMYLYVYGSYGYGIAPEFPVFALSAIDRGFTYAIVHVRGGDELGLQWHEQGRLLNRKNSFKDLVSAAQYFVDEGLVKKGNIVVSGESAGGTTIGYAINDQPDLFKSVASLVPFVDVLNSLMDETMDLTPVDWGELGNPTIDKKVFDYIKSYSPYDNVKAQNYPNIYASAGLNDHAVGYWEPVKWIYKIRKVQTNSSTTLIDLRDGGHVKSGKYQSEYQFAKLVTFMIVTSK